MVRGLILEPPTIASIPEPERFAKVAGRPLKASVGLPPVPLALETLKPAPETAIEREATVEAESFTIMPPAAFWRLRAVPLRLIWKYEVAPPSTIEIPVPAVT
jgi:hypothetical protein